MLLRFNPLQKNECTKWKQHFLVKIDTCHFLFWPFNQNSSVAWQSIDLWIALQSQTATINNAFPFIRTSDKGALSKIKKIDITIWYSLHSHSMECKKKSLS